MHKTLILVVEDEVIVAENIRSKLEKSGYLVPETVTSGEQALECLKELQIDLVLMDIELEGKMDGIQAAESIRAQYGLPIIYLTAYADEKTLQRARVTEPFGYLLKPFQTRELHSNIEMALYKHRMEYRLKASEERYRRISTAITDYIYTVNIQNLEILETTHNAACFAVTGYSEEEFLQNAQLWHDIVYEADRDAVDAQRESILRQKTATTLEHRIIRKDRVVRWVKNTPVLHFNQQGDLTSYDALIQDITERKESELALEAERTSLAQRIEERTFELKRANAELARASRMKDEFLATMSHEFRTPLHTILGMTEALQEEIFGPLVPKQQDALTNIQESGRHLLSLIKDILDLAKIGAGRLTLHMTNVSVDSLCQASLRFVKQESMKKRLQVSFTQNSDIKSLEADERRLKQILVNLLSNAVKFTPENGKIGLQVDGSHEQEQISFTIWDTGIGIAREDIDRLFQPFVQLDGTFTRKHSGTGLGLSLVARMVDMHGGSVTVESKEGQGSRFIVTMPLQLGGQETSNASNVTEKTAPPSEGDKNIHTQKEKDLTGLGAKRRILLAEDQEANLNMLTKYLELKGYQVIPARNGREAIERIENDDPELILMDIQMPEIDGLKAIQTIRENRRMRSIPVFALTALAMPGDQERCLAAGANEYLSKPVNLKLLAPLIHQYLNPT